MQYVQRKVVVQLLRGGQIWAKSEEDILRDEEKAKVGQKWGKVEE